jgi:hypothetical protein
MLTSRGWPSPTGFGLQEMRARVLYVSSGVAPAGSGIDFPVCGFVTGVPAGSVV